MPPVSGQQEGVLPDPDPDPETETKDSSVSASTRLQISETRMQPTQLTGLIIGDIPDFPPNRRTLYKVRDNMFHHWMLTRLEVDKVNCHIYMDVEGEPSHREVLGYCGYRVYQMWLNGVCNQINDRETPCEGLTLHYIGPMDEKLRYSIKLPGAVAYSGLVNCHPWGVCSAPPQMFFGGRDPLQIYHIAQVHIDFQDGQKITCAAGECAVLMPLTGISGMEATYYVTSSYGDDSLKTRFKYRNINLGDGNHLFQVIGADWDYLIPVSAAQWEFFPSLEMELTPWLTPISTADKLYSIHDFSYLAGVLIQRGEVSAAGCADGGLALGGVASTCGIEAAREGVIAAQNQFNEEIFAAAVEARVPAKLLKGVIGQESQFWNGWVIVGEYGYGMLTDQGADMLLNWHVPTFLNLCIPVFGRQDCAWGYSELAEYPQAYLRGLALQDIGTDDEFELIARTLAAAAGQAGQIVRNVTGSEVGEVLDYREMWMISLGIYHGGSGCVGTAIEEAWEAEGVLSWGLISYYLPGDCGLIAPYPYRVIEFAEMSFPFAD
jgi:hypothetical protein